MGIFHLFRIRLLIEVKKAVQVSNDSNCSFHFKRGNLDLNELLSRSQRG